MSLNLKSLFYRFWYFFWFIALPLTLAWFIVLILVRAQISPAMEEVEIWHVLLVFAVLAFLTYSLRDKLPFWRDLDESSEYNRARRRKEAAQIAKGLRKILKKKGHKVPKKGKVQLDEVLENLESQIANKEDDKIIKTLKVVEDKSDRYLAFAKKSTGREYFESIGIAILVAILLRFFVVEAFKIPSESMVPTLMVGDHIFVSKYRYGLSLPHNNQRIVRFARPAYGEVVVFLKPDNQPPGNPSIEAVEDDMVGKDFIKRIVGLPGDTIEMRDDVLFVNGKKIPRCRVGDQKYRSRTFTQNWVDAMGELWVEKHGDHIYTVLEEPGMSRPFGPITVPPDRLFVLGDNRDNSNDSRYWGTVPFDAVKGRAMFIWWSNRRPYGFQWDRIGKIIMGEPELTEEQEAAIKTCPGFQ